MTKKIILFLLPTVMLFAVGCKDDTPLTISVVPSAISAPSEGGVYDVTVSASGYWSAAITDSMLYITPSTGKAGETKVQITVAPATDMLERKGGVLFTCGDNQVMLSITRSGLEEVKNYIKVDLTEINAPASGGNYRINIESNVQWQAASSVDWVTLHKTQGQDNDSIAVTVNPNSVSTDLQSGIITISEQSAPDNKVEITVTREGMVVKPAFKYAFFSVDSYKQVQFSPGNLQYQASTRKWRFAEYQYDIIGEDNANISDTYSGWIDLFGWGTGDNPTLHTENESDYSSFHEWGNNSISNDDYDKPYYGQWCTLSKNEWEYLLVKRKNAASLFALGTANGVPGAIILPDDWQLPAGMSFKTWEEEGLKKDDASYVWTWDNNTDHPFDANTYSASEWAIMEKAGAVFLPAAGGRVGTYVTIREGELFGEKISFIVGYYWTSSTNAYKFSFEEDTLYSCYSVMSIGGDDYIYCGHSVRLVYKEIVIN